MKKITRTQLGLWTTVAAVAVGYLAVGTGALSLTLSNGLSATSIPQESAPGDSIAATAPIPMPPAVAPVSKMPEPPATQPPTIEKARTTVTSQILTVWRDTATGECRSKTLSEAEATDMVRNSTAADTPAANPR